MICLSLQLMVCELIFLGQSSLLKHPLKFIQTGGELPWPGLWALHFYPFSSHCLPVLSPAFLPAPDFLPADSVLTSLPVCISCFHPFALPFLDVHSNSVYSSQPWWDSCPSHGISPPAPTAWETLSLSYNWLCPPHDSCPTTPPCLFLFAWLPSTAPSLCFYKQPASTW